MKIENMIRQDLLDIKPYSSARDEYSGKEGVFLDANENPFENGFNRYPDPLQRALKVEVSKLKSVSVNNVFFGNGSDECIDLLIRLVCVPGLDRVSTISPSYGMYSVSAKINQVKLVDILLNDDFSLNVERTLKEAAGSKIVFLCSPNNPTGNAFLKDDLVKILEGFKGLVVVDEAYIDFSERGSILTELDKFQNLVILQTFSKAFGMAGLRLGMLFASAELIGWMNKIKPPYNINELTQKTALLKLKESKKIQEQVEFLIGERVRLNDELSKNALIEKVYPSDANFILIKVKDSAFMYNYLVNNNIIVRNRSNQPLCENCIRITIGTKEENDVLLKKMNELNNSKK